MYKSLTPYFVLTMYEISTLDAKQQSINELLANQVEVKTKRISFLSLYHSRPHTTEQRTRKHVIGQNEEHAPYQHLG